MKLVQVIEAGILSLILTYFLSDGLQEMGIKLSSSLSILAGILLGMLSIICVKIMLDD